MDNRENKIKEDLENANKFKEQSESKIKEYEVILENAKKEVEDKVGEVHGVESSKVNIVFDPPWDKDMMSEEAKLDLGMI